MLADRPEQVVVVSCRIRAGSEQVDELRNLLAQTGST